MKTKFVLFALLLLLGCSKPEKDMIISDFNRIYPNATIISVGTGEGDFDNVYYEIKYILDSKTLESSFLYQKINGVWKLYKQ